MRGRAMPKSQKRPDECFGAFMERVKAPITQEQRIRSAKCLEDLSESDVLGMLRCQMLQEGVKPLSRADNILAHLRARVDQREAEAEGAPQDPLQQGLEVLSMALAPLEESQRQSVCAGIAVLPKHPDALKKVVEYIAALRRLNEQYPHGGGAAS